MKPKKPFLPQGVRGIIYSFVPFKEVMSIITKLSSAERKFVRNTQLLDWRPEHKQFDSIIEELSYMKHLSLKLNSTLTANDLKTINEAKLEYLIGISEVVFIHVDY